MCILDEMLGDIPYLSEFRTWPEFRPVLGCFTFCGVTSRCVTILMMLKCLKMLKINVNLNIYSYFNILRFLYFLKIFLNLCPKYGSPKIFEMGGVTSRSKFLFNILSLQLCFI
jgi:hypothetical protein